MSEYYLFTNPLILEVTGKDAKRYLNARLTNNIKELQIGSSCLAGMLNPQGRTEGLFTVLHQTENEFIIYCDGGEHEKIIASLKRYIVADRVTIRERSPAWGLLHIFSEIQVEETVSIKRKRSSDAGTDLLGEKDILLKIQGKKLTDKEYTAKRIRAGVISYPEELNESNNFAEANLHSAVSFTKGCYVGQEVIEKINAFGRVPRTIETKVIKGKEVAVTDREKILTSTYDESTDETLMFVSVLK